MSGDLVAWIELAVGVVTGALAIPLWRAGGRWPRLTAILLVIAGAAAVASALSSLWSA